MEKVELRFWLRRLGGWYVIFKLGRRRSIFGGGMKTVINLGLDMLGLECLCEMCRRSWLYTFGVGNVIMRVGN